MVIAVWGEGEKMPRLINAETLVEYKASGISDLTEWQKGWNDAIDTIMGETPTVDAEPVVRCKDCTRYVPFKDVDGACLAHNKGVLIIMSQNGYCNLGERREDDTKRCD